MKHKHAELIKAWADGAQIECKQIDGSWFNGDGETSPSWNEDYEYRIKPEPKPDHYQQYRIDEHGMPWLSGVANLRLHFDGETGRLKSAEVL